MAHLADNPLDDERVSVQEGDVANMIKRGRGAYSAILLDVDNGPVAMVDANNEQLYSTSGIRLMCRALKKGGRIAVWSARPDLKFEKRLGKFQRVAAKVYDGAKRARHVLYILDPN